MPKKNPIFRTIILIFAILTIMICPLLYVGISYFPSALSSLDPLICPSGMHLDTTTESLSDPRGNVTASYSVCTDGQQEVDVTGRMLIVLFGLAVLGVVLLVSWALMAPSKEPEKPTFNLEGE